MKYALIWLWGATCASAFWGASVFKTTPAGKPVSDLCVAIGIILSVLALCVAVWQAWEEK